MNTLLQEKSQQNALQNKLSAPEGSEGAEAQSAQLAPPTFQLKAEPLQCKPEEEEGMQLKRADAGSFVPQMKAEEEETLQQKSAPGPFAVQKKAAENTTGMPDGVKNKMESSIGADFSNVNIHTNSSQATQMKALAFAQGNDVHFAPGQYDPGSQKGQELIGHELTHVKQQAQGRVQPTTQAKGMAVNDDAGLEKEADVMGAKAASGSDVSTSAQLQTNTATTPVQAKMDTVQAKESKEEAAKKYLKIVKTGMINLTSDKLVKQYIKLFVKKRDGFDWVNVEAAERSVKEAYNLFWKVALENDSFSSLYGHFKARAGGSTLIPKDGILLVLEALEENHMGGAYDGDSDISSMGKFARSKQFDKVFKTFHN